uniref:BRO1 domain-containing protein n=1 Tax=Alexandrium monilatum TaxID=311494 RepID=A0A7S4QWU8_9DINO|mmetsp:Transcript_80375/g.239416  ORF Transcript_80375/g.239416 Transcript_80375/m.239416 type:complete len:124 (+) Transcript_80375:118-489(+)
MPRGPSEQDLKDALATYNMQKELCMKEGDKLGQAEAALAMSQIHVMAGKIEDARRLQNFLPMAKMHSAMAGANAEMAQGLYSELGAEKYSEQLKAAQTVLDMERVQWTAAYRGSTFDYNYQVG